MNVTIDYFPSRSGCDDLQSGDSVEDNDSIVPGDSCVSPNFSESADCRWFFRNFPKIYIAILGVLNGPVNNICLEKIAKKGGEQFQKKIKQKRKLFANRRRRKGGGRSQYQAALIFGSPFSPTLSWNSNQAVEACYWSSDQRLKTNWLRRASSLPDHGKKRRHWTLQTIFLISILSDNSNLQQEFIRGNQWLKKVLLVDVLGPFYF